MRPLTVMNFTLAQDTIPHSVTEAGSSVNESSLNLSQLRHGLKMSIGALGPLIFDDYTSHPCAFTGKTIHLYKSSTASHLQTDRKSTPTSMYTKDMSMVSNDLPNQNVSRAMPWEDEKLVREGMVMKLLVIYSALTVYLYY